MAAQYIPIKRISSLDTPIRAEKLDGSLFTTENQAHEFIISVRKNGVKQTVTGSVSGKFIRTNGTTIFLQGSIVDGDAVVRLHQDCYNVQGRFTFNIFNTQSGVTTCIYSAVGKIDMGSTETVIDAGDVVPDVADVVAKQEEMTQVIADARTATTAANTAATHVGSIVARPYSPPYKAGEHCTQNGNLYNAKQDIPEDEEWTASHWTQIVMGDEVTDLKSATNRIALISNLYSYGTISFGYNINTLGNLSANADYNTTDFIDVSNIDVLYANRGKRYCYFNSNKEFISYSTLDNREELIAGSGIRYIPVKANRTSNPNIKYLRIAVPSNEFNISYMCSSNDYEKYLLGIIDTKFNTADAGILKNSIDRESISGNLYAYGTITYGYALNTLGNLSTNSDYNVTDYIDVTGISQLYANVGGRYCYYDSNKDFVATSKLQDRSELISGSGIRVIPVDGNKETYPTIKYIRMTIPVSGFDGAYMMSPSAYDIYLKNLITNVVRDKKIYCIGDSITRGIYTNAGDTSGRGPTPLGYPYWIGEINKYNVVNLGESSGGYVLLGDTSKNIITIVDENTFEDADFVTIAFGINDWKSVTPVTLGSVNTSVKKDGSVIGNMMYGIEKIIEKKPTANLIIMLPMNQNRFLNVEESTNWSMNHENNGKTLQDYRDAITECAEHYNIKVIDPETVCPINRLNIRTMLGDGLHPTLAFYKQMGESLAPLIH